MIAAALFLLLALTTWAALRRNEQVYERASELLRDAHACGLGDIDAGRDPSWRLEQAASVLDEYHRWVVAFWRPLDRWGAGEPWRCPGPPSQSEATR